MRLPPRLPDKAVTAFYLHGFASSPESSKAIRIARELESIGVPTRIPDLNQPEFRTLTVTRMIGQVRDAMEEDVVLIGSSLGAFVAVNTAAVDERVKGLVLLAPAFDFGADERGQVGTVKVADWKREGRAEVFHYAWNRPEMLDYALCEDAHRYDAFALQLGVPVLIFQGTRDTIVNPAIVERWAAARPHVRLVMLDDDHQLQSSIDTIAGETKLFVGSLR